VRPVAGGAHDGDDLFDLRRIGRVAQTLVAWSVTGMESRHRRRRSTSTGTIEQKLGHDPSSGSWNEPDYRREANALPRPPRYRFRHGAAVKADPRALSRLPHCDSDGARAPYDRELARADVVPMHRTQRVGPSDASVGRPERARAGRWRRRSLGRAMRESEEVRIGPQMDACRGKADGEPGFETGDTTIRAAAGSLLTA
jgi:hypothetical protein